jgi:hypothetical protein
MCASVFSSLLCLWVRLQLESVKAQAGKVREHSPARRQCQQCAQRKPPGMLQAVAGQQPSGPSHGRTLCATGRSTRQRRKVAWTPTEPRAMPSKRDTYALLLPILAGQHTLKVTGGGTKSAHTRGAAAWEGPKAGWGGQEGRVGRGPPSASSLQGGHSHGVQGQGQIWAHPCANVVVGQRQRNPPARRAPLRMKGPRGPLSTRQGRRRIAA